MNFYKKPSEPAFLIIGAQKAGTTALFNFICQHPNVKPPTKKEIHYFDLFYERGTDWYFKNFKKENLHITGEATPYYLFHPLAPIRVQKILPNIKIIIIIRNPIDRAISHYSMNIRKKIENRSFIEAVEFDKIYTLKEEKFLISKKLCKSYFHQHYSYLSRGRYFRQINHWFDFFPKKNFFIIQHKNLLETPNFILKELYKFLDLPNQQKIIDSIIIKEIHKGLYFNIEEVKIWKNHIKNEFIKDNLMLELLLDRKFNWNE